jgi:hypothetical protein
MTYSIPSDRKRVVAVMGNMYTGGVILEWDEDFTETSGWVTGQQAINYGNPEGVDLWVTRRNSKIARVRFPAQEHESGSLTRPVEDADGIQIFSWFQPDVSEEIVFDIEDAEIPLYYSYLFWVNEGQTETLSNEEVVTADNREVSIR